MTDSAADPGRTLRRGGEGFARDRVTWLAYGALASYAFWLYGLGPVLALLRRDLGLSYTMVSLHTTLWATGTVVTGVLYDRLVGRLGRRTVFWGSAATACVGAAALGLGRTAWATLLAVSVLGTAGTLLQTGTSSVLSDRHGRLRDRAFVEANVGASAVAVLAPAVIGALAGTALGWRVALAVPAAVLAILFAVLRGAPLGGTRGRSTAAGRLPASYWVLATLVAVVVGIEFCVVFFGALLLTQATGLTTAAAATAMSAFAVGELAGRLAGSRFTRRPDRGPRLLVAALAATAATFGLLWLSRSPAVSVLALGLLGVSVANLYPLAFAQAVGAAADRADAAAARVQLLIGAAVIAGPLALGTLSDGVGVVSAFAVEPVLLALAVVLLVLGRRAADREAGAAATTPPRAGDGGFAGPVR